MRFFNENEFLTYYYKDYNLVDVVSYYPLCGVFSYSEANLKARLNSLMSWNQKLSSKTALKTRVAELSKKLNHPPSCFKNLGDNNFLTAVWFMELHDQKLMIFLSNKGLNLYVEKEHKIKDIFAVVNELLSVGDFL